MATLNDSFSVPYRDAVVEKGGLLSSAWQTFIRTLFDRVQPMGVERVVQLANNSGPDPIDGMKVNARAVSQAIVEYLVQRITDSSTLIESGIFLLTYNPTDEDWDLSVVSEHLPSDAGVTFTVSADGQVNVTTSNQSGTPSITRIVYRTRTLAGKSTQYSSQGTR